MLSWLVPRGIAFGDTSDAHRPVPAAVNAAGSRSGGFRPCALGSCARLSPRTIAHGYDATGLLGRQRRFIGRSAPRAAPIEAGCLYKIAHSAIAMLDLAHHHSSAAFVMFCFCRHSPCPQIPDWRTACTCKRGYCTPGSQRRSLKRRTASEEISLTRSASTGLSHTGKSK
jgi:hypothetical protein